MPRGVTPQAPLQSARQVPPVPSRALIIFPTYDERENLPQIVPAVLSQSPELDVLVVDDNSPDGTGELADRLAADDTRVSVLHRSAKQGLGTAYVAGFHWALQRGYSHVFEMDADFSHDPADVPRLLAAAAEADMVIGSRWVPGGGTRNWSVLRQLISRGGSAYAGLLLGLPVRDATSGFKCFRAETLDALDLESVHSNGYGFQVELNYQCYRRGLRIKEVPIVFVDRRVGKSKMSSRIVLEAMLMCWKLRGQHPRLSELNPKITGKVET